MAGSGTGGGRILTVVSATVLVASEVLATAVAAGWALSGLFNLGAIGQYALIGLFSALALYLCYVYFRRAASVELSGKI